MTYFTRTYLNLCPGFICYNEDYKVTVARPAQVTKKIHKKHKYSTNKFTFNYFFSQKLVNNSLELFHLPLTRASDILRCCDFA